MQKVQFEISIFELHSQSVREEEEEKKEEGESKR